MYERYRKGLYWIGDECYKVLALSMIRKAEVSGCIYLCLILYFFVCYHGEEWVWIESDAL